MRRIYGSRAINASAPNVAQRGESPAAPGATGSTGGLSSESSWRAFFGPKPAASTPGVPALWERMRNNQQRTNLTNKPISDQAWSKIREDTNPFKNIGLAPQTQTTAQLAPDDAPDVSSVASFYEPPPQLGGPRSLLMDPESFGSMNDSPMGGSSAFFKKYGKMRDLSTLGQDNFML